jgi:DNA-binding transcriptional ArsR family regulator
MSKNLAGQAFQALGDANRRAIVEELGKGERSVVELTRRLRISQPAVSRHLRLLKQAGLVDEQPIGTKHMYRLRDEGVLAVRGYFEKVWGEAAARFRLAAANTSSPRSPRRRR